MVHALTALTFGLCCILAGFLVRFALSIADVGTPSWLGLGPLLQHVFLGAVGMGLVGFVSLCAGALGGVFLAHGRPFTNLGFVQGLPRGKDACATCCIGLVVVGLALGIGKVLYSTYHMVLGLTEGFLAKAENMVENIQ